MEEIWKDGNVKKGKRNTLLPFPFEQNYSPISAFFIVKIVKMMEEVRKWQKRLDRPSNIPLDHI